MSGNKIETPSAAILSIRAMVPESAATAGLLGTEREGTAVRISEDGLLVTIGYLVVDAEEVWLTNHLGEVSQAWIVAHDFDVGLAILKPSAPIGNYWLRAGDLEEVIPGTALRASNAFNSIDCAVVGKREFVGRWEYVLDEALFTAPGIEDWSGSALLNEHDELLGIGSLATEVQAASNVVMQGNMFVPFCLGDDELTFMRDHGRASNSPRPWMGTLVQDFQGQLIVAGIYKDCPAHLAGVEPGDIILSVDGEPVKQLAQFFRSVWLLGEAGVVVPLTIERQGTKMKYKLNSVDRHLFQLSPTRILN
ncbi:MAG: serine protease [Proteobacteria bacterium]|jgi:S1-C subfamily serine protease|nr:serine protease [Pseudomonadota bacterium]